MDFGGKVMGDLYALSEMMSQIKENLEGILLLFYLIVGFMAAAQCFFGYKLIRIWITIIGCVTGALVGAIIGGIGGGEGMAVLCMLVCMILGGFLAYKVYMIGIFFVGLLGGAIIGTGLGIMIDMGTESIAMGFIVGILSGVGAILLAKPVIILVTAISSGVELAGVIGIMVEDAGVGIFFGLIFAIGGIWFQFKDNKKGEKLVAPQKEVAINQVAAALEEPVVPMVEAVKSESQPAKMTNFIVEKTGKTKEEWMELGKQYGTSVLKKVKQYIELGKKRGQEGYKKFMAWLKPLKSESVEKAKVAWEILQRPHVKKKCLIGGGVLAGIFILILGGKLMYKDSLRYRIPEESRLQELANEYLQPGIDYRSPLELQSIHKQNRKAYDITLEGQYQKGDILMLGTFKADYTYDGDEWSMSIPELETSKEVSVTGQVYVDEVYEYLRTQLDLDEDHDPSTPMIIKSNNIVSRTGSTDHEMIYAYTFQVVEGISGYEVVGEIGYKIGEDYTWEVDPASLTYEALETSVVTKPDEAEMIQTLSTQGIEIQGYGKVYYAEQMMQVELKIFEKKGTNWQATYSVLVDAPYLSGSFDVTIPYKVEDERLYMDAIESIKAVHIQMSEAEAQLPTLDQEALRNVWKENNRISIYNEEQQETVSYTLTEATQITIGSRCSVDFRNENEKLVIGYPIQLVTDKHQLSCEINIPYKEVFDEVLEQLRLVTYTHMAVDVYPITEERIKEDSKNIYLKMESSTEVVNRNTGENIEKLDILNTTMEQDKEVYTVIVKFNIEENNESVTYVGEYDVTYKKKPFEYTLHDIQFKD